MLYCVDALGSGVAALYKYKHQLHNSESEQKHMSNLCTGYVVEKRLSGV